MAHLFIKAGHASPSSPPQDKTLQDLCSKLGYGNARWQLPQLPMTMEHCLKFEAALTKRLTERLGEAISAGERLLQNLDEAAIHLGMAKDQLPKLHAFLE
jgi:hypothetical protein